MLNEAIKSINNFEHPHICLIIKWDIIWLFAAYKGGLGKLRGKGWEEIVKCFSCQLNYPLKSYFLYLFTCTLGGPCGGLRTKCRNWISFPHVGPGYQTRSPGCGKQRLRAEPFRWSLSWLCLNRTLCVLEKMIDLWTLPPSKWPQSLQMNWEYLLPHCIVLVVPGLQSKLSRLEDSSMARTVAM